MSGPLHRITLPKTTSHTLIVSSSTGMGQWTTQFLNSTTNMTHNSKWQVATAFNPIKGCWQKQTTICLPFLKYGAHTSKNDSNTSFSIFWLFKSNHKPDSQFKIANGHCHPPSRRILAETDDYKYNIPKKRAYSIQVRIDIYHSYLYMLCIFGMANI